MPYLTPKQGSQIVKLMIAGMVAFLLLLGYVYLQKSLGQKHLIEAEHKARSALIDSQRAGCNRAKLDRKANAEFQRAQADYITKVVLAQSVKEDVKRAAREAKKVFLRTSGELTERSLIDCSKAFPKESN